MLAAHPATPVPHAPFSTLLPQTKTYSSLDTAFDNFGADENSLLHACEAAAHVFSVSMVSTSDLGEIPIPKGYQQATTGPWAEYCSGSPT